MRIAFLVPFYSGRIVGSSQVYYRFAGEMARRGHSVDIWHPHLVSDRSTRLERIHAAVWCAFKSLSSSPIPWFPLERGVRARFRPRLEGLRLDHDVVVAFGWRGIEVLRTVEGGARRFGYVMEYETWAEAAPDLRDRMEASYRSPVAMLASSEIVHSMLLSVGCRDARVCVHGIDTEVFRCRVPARERDARRVGFPARTEPVKSPEVLAEVLAGLRREVPGRVVTWGFGGEDVPESLRSSFDEYHVSPSHLRLADLHNASSIFVLPSRKEGFGMPAAEAIACGSAVVSVDNGGIHTFGVDGRNCRIVPESTPAALIGAVRELLDDDEKRRRISTAASGSMENLSWKAAGERLAREIGA